MKVYYVIPVSYWLTGHLKNSQNQTVLFSRNISL